MFEWRVNQIRVDMMERVLNHMEKQGYEVQVIVPLQGGRFELGSDTDSTGAGGAAVRTEVLLAGKKLLNEKLPEMHKGMPAVTPENLDVVYGREKANSIKSP
ncbi:MAG: hypothetical protein JST89_20105 [Cyanobacteria bacterium SZAS-4]|nr:hypothetical protein [Cyanobacteria bacterium SZAS-4]